MHIYKCQSGCFFVNKMIHLASRETHVVSHVHLDNNNHVNREREVSSHWVK